MAEEFLESEILFSDSDSEQTFGNAEYHDLKTQNEVKFYYDHADDDCGVGSYENRRQSYGITTMEEKTKSKGTAPIQIPWKFGQSKNRIPSDNQEQEIEDCEYSMLPPHEIMHRRFPDRGRRRNPLI